MKRVCVMDNSLRRMAIKTLFDMYPLFRKAMAVPMESCKENITKTQMRTLIILGDWENVNMSKLAEEVAISPQQLSKIITELENKGYVMRINDREYRRIVWVSLTEKGKELIQQHRERAVEEVEKLFERFSDDEVRTLMEASRTMQEIISKLKQ